VKHKDPNIAQLLRAWGCRTDQSALRGSFEFDGYNEMLDFFEEALQDTPVRDFSARHHKVGGQVYDLVSLLWLLDRLKPDDHISHVAAAARFGWNEQGAANADYGAFNRVLGTPAEYVHGYVQAAQRQLRGRSIADQLKQAHMHGIPADYLGRLPLKRDFDRSGAGYDFNAVMGLWREDIPADYVARAVPADPEAFPRASTISALYRVGVDPDYVSATLADCGVGGTMRYFRQGIPPEFATAMGRLDTTS
jgi:hypothetical protein